MPGMMNTILNLGLTDASVEGLAKKTGNARFAYDSYRRVIDMFGSTAMGVEHEDFEHEISKLKAEKGVKLDTDLTVDDLKELVKRYKAAYKKHVKDDFPQDPKKQLMLAINAVFNSWNGNKAIEYRRIERITGLKGTAVNVQAMVFSTWATRPAPASPSRAIELRREPFLRRLSHQRAGRDVVAGIRTPEHIAKFEQDMPPGVQAMCDIRQTLESTTRRCRTSSSPCRKARCSCCKRSGKRTGTAAVHRRRDGEEAHR